MDLLAQASWSAMSIDSVLSVSSAALTGYFWLIRSRRERPCLKIYQVADFRATLRSARDNSGGKRLGLTQLSGGGVMVANHSTNPNSIVAFECYLRDGHGWLRGDWGWTGDDRPPWNVPPQTTISISPACFFSVPADYEMPDELTFRVDFITVAGHRFSHVFSREARDFCHDEQKQAA